ncbi:MAG: peptide chain release factor N(5)-glutamine methyltransferase [Candidatus Eremiobacteraeota bacterium]|nr:peptide chain release factor N(5)-glutamine methyltransferase [Candidatus Eremiobacteraeota bacterium]
MHPQGQGTPPTVAQTLQLAVSRLDQALDNSSPRLDAEVLLAHVQNWTRTELHCRITDPLPESQLQEFLRLLDERVRGVPVAYLVGYKEFYSRRFWVRPGVLVPRPETELLVERALGELRKTPGPTRILDLCCGSGCIAVTLCLETLGTTAIASDISVEALEQTRENIQFFGVEERVRAVESDLFSALSKEAFDLIVSNPPYVGTEYGPAANANVAAHEPALALYSGSDGMNHLKQIVERAPAYLIEGGSLVLECASFQAERVEAWMDEKGFNQTCLWHDLSGLPRGVAGRWEG